MTATQRRAALSRETHVAALLHHLDRHRRALDVRASIGTADLRLLWLLSDGEPRTLRGVADALHLEQSTVNRQVNAAVQAGHLRRFRSPGSPAYLFEPTAEGRARFASETAASLGLYDQVLEQMGPQDTARLLELLGRFVDLYGQAVERSTGTVTPPG